MWQKKWFLFTVVAVLAIALMGIGYLSYAQEANVDNDPHATGLIVMTPEENAFFMKTHPKVLKVLPNELGLERINNKRKAKGLTPLSLSVPSVQGEEIISAIPGKAPKKNMLSDVILPAELPVGLDNSLLPAFPPIRSQGNLGSCTTFASTYYQLTHMAGLMYGWNNKNEDNTTKFSPRWTYNFANNGVNQGSGFSENHNILQSHGAPTWAEFPYDGVDYTQWCLNTSAWYNALKYRMNPSSYIGSVDTTAGLDLVKQILNNGYVVIFGTYISSWNFTTIKNDPATSQDDAFVGKDIGYWVNGTAGAHAMTIVGYNDSIWTDINKNRKVDPGEKGALRIANSWGSAWKDSGFTWIAYDALKAVSAVSGAPYSNRIGAFFGNYVFVTTLRDHYTPKMVAEFTVNHAKRNQLMMNMGISETTEAPTIKWYPGVFGLRGGAYAFNGSTTACDGIFVLDFTDILPPGITDKIYYLGMYDSVTGDIATLKSLVIKDILHNAVYNVVNPPGLPHMVDKGQDYASIDCPFNNPGTNNPPVTVIAASPVSGTAPLTVNFDGQGSSDSDGTITDSYWNFGDGRAVGDSLAVSCPYPNPGVYAAKLTVVDNLGAQSSDVLIITLDPEPAKTMRVSSIGMSISYTGNKKYAKAAVMVVDGSGASVSRATVSGHWSGLTTDTDSGNTTGNGQVTFSSNSVSKTASGTFTFTIDSVVLSGWTLDVGGSVMTNSISTP